MKQIYRGNNQYSETSEIRKSTVRSLIDGATHSIFGNIPLSTHGYEYQVCSSRVLQLSNSGEILLRVASEREQEVVSENTIFYPIIE